MTSTASGLPEPADLEDKLLLADRGYDSTAYTLAVAAIVPLDDLVARRQGRPQVAKREPVTADAATEHHRKARARATNEQRGAVPGFDILLAHERTSYHRRRVPCYVELVRHDELIPTVDHDPEHGRKRERDRGHEHDHKHGSDHGHEHSHKRGGDHGRAQDHGHGHAHPPTTAHRLALTLAVTSVIMIAEVVGGLVSGSLALLADAGHMLTDLLALLVAFAAVVLGALPGDDRRTYGYRRLEILAALFNGVALIVVSGSIIVEAVKRWSTPREIDAVLMGAIAAIGLVANLAGLWLLGGDRRNLNVRGAFLHMLGDALSSVGVLVVAGVIAVTGWTQADAVVSLLIAVVIVVTSVSLLREVVDVLLESAPRDIDTDEVRRMICGVPGVDGVFDLHIWSITSGMPALSAHVVVAREGVDRDQVLRCIQDRLEERFAIGHATLQLEAEAHGECYCAEAAHATARGTQSTPLGPGTAPDSSHQGKP